MPSIPNPEPSPDRDLKLLESQLRIARLMSYGPLSTEVGE